VGAALATFFAAKAAPTKMQKLKLLFVFLGKIVVTLEIPVSDAVMTLSNSIYLSTRLRPASLPL